MNIKTFGKDHWSLLGFIYTQVVEKKNLLDLRRLRINAPKRGYSNTVSSNWEPSYGTKITDGSIPDPNHDDIDCLNDLENSGLVINKFTDLNPIVELTKFGFTISEKLNRHLAEGGTFSNFKY